MENVLQNNSSNKVRLDWIGDRTTFEMPTSKSKISPDKSNDEGTTPHQAPPHPVLPSPPLKGILKNKTEQSPIAPNVSNTHNRSDGQAVAITNRITSTNTPSTSLRTHNENEFDNHHFLTARDSRIVTMERLALGKGKRAGNNRDVPNSVNLQLSRKKRQDEDRDPSSGEDGPPGDSVAL